MMANSKNLKPLSGKISRIGMLIAIAGLILAVMSYIDNPVRAAYSNIIAFIFLFGLGTCSLFLVALEYISGAVWSVVFRRIAEFSFAFADYRPDFGHSCTFPTTGNISLGRSFGLP